MWRTLRPHLAVIRTQGFASLRTDVLFWLSLPVSLGALLVPQVRTLITQLVDPPGLLEASSVADVPALLFSQSTVEAAGFLVYLSALAAVLAASVLFVVPPSFLATGTNAGEPIRLPKAPGRRTAVAVAVLLAALPVFVLLPVPPLLLMAGTAVLLFRPAGRFVGRRAGWLVAAAEAASPRGRRLAGIALVLTGAAIALVVGARGHSSRLYPLAGSACQLVGGLGLLAGLWLASLPPGATRLGPVRTAQGRLIGWLIAAWAVGESVWVLAVMPGADRYVSYRLYTVWAALTLPTVLILTASLLDTWDQATGCPVRLAGLAAAAGLLLLLAPPEPLESADPVVGQGTAPDDWPGHLLERVRSVPPGEPVVLVAAAGGGSRAAIFAGLVLEALAREPFPQGRPDDTWAGHVVLISGVSGGSLGTATVVQRMDRLAAAVRPGGGPAGAAAPDVERDDLRNSVRAELVRRMRRKAAEMVRLVEGAEGADERERQAYLAACRETAAECEGLTEDLVRGRPFRSWVLRSAVMDDLCTDFMAPVLRGALTPGLSRGASLRHFWAERFGWGASCDRGGYYRKADPVPFDPAVHPLVVFNATDVRRGCRLAVGFPPLPAGLLTEVVADQANNAPPGGQRRPVGPRNPPETLADLDPGRVVGLAQAVGLSANFPFGFNAAAVQRVVTERDEEKRERKEAALKERDDWTAKVLDGGIVDNTGIDTLHLLVKAVQARGEPVGAKGVYADLWKELRDRRVLLLEIDSGAKPERPGPATRLLSVLLDPLAGLNNAGFTNAALAKQTYLTGLEAAFRLPVDLTAALREATDPDTRRELLKRQGQGVARFSPVKFDANHFDGDNVLTAWSLAPDDKALLLVRFLVEARLAARSLASAAALPRWTAEQERAEASRAADTLVAQLRAEHDAARLERNLRRLAGDLEEIDRLRREGAKGRDALLARLKTVEAGVQEAARLAGQRGPRGPEVAGRIAALERTTRDIRGRLERGQAATEAMYGALAEEGKGALPAAIRTVAGERQQTRESADHLLGAINPQGRLQAEYTSRARESRNLFDRPPAKR